MKSAVDVVARLLFVVEDMERGYFSREDAETAWDNDALLTEVYEEYEAKARKALNAAK